MRFALKNTVSKPFAQQNGFGRGNIVHKRLLTLAAPGERILRAGKIKTACNKTSGTKNGTFSGG